jgi:transposase-like protein
MHCIKCQSQDYCKNGMMRGKQRYRCNSCGYNFTNTHGRGHTPDKRLMALKLYKEGLGFSGAGRVLGVSDVTVLNWVRDAGEKIKETLLAQIPPAIDAMDIIEIDEMWHYTQKNSVNYGYGLLCLAPRDASLPWKWAVVATKRSSGSGQG